MQRQASRFRARSGRRAHAGRLAGLPVLQNAFRPFFLGGAAFAALALAVWLAALAGRIEIPSAFGALLWHQHEMLFGYAGAIIAGFALTAVPNWTGRLPIAGWPLAALAGLWLTGRLAVMRSEAIGAGVALVLDTGFLGALAALVLREIVAGGSWRNLPVGTLIAALAVANLLTHLEPVFALETAALGIRLGLAIVLILIGLIGGRVTPSFTRNWLARQGPDGLPAPFGRFDQVALALLILALLAWVVAPEATAAAALLVIAGALHGVRLARWQGRRTTAEPLVLILHVGYGWLALGLLLLGLDGLALLPIPLAALHALTAGAIGTMTLAVMTRASLGHTGRPLTAGRLTVLIYVLVVTGSLLRVLAPALPAAPLLLAVASLLWGGAFAVFVASYGPMLARRPAGAGP